MNHALSMLAAAALLVAGCGGSNNNGTGGNGGSGGSGGGGGSSGVDMSATASGDAGMTLPPDMQPAYGCHALSGCEDACTDQQSCLLCIQSATSNARKLYQAETRCIRSECFPHPDGGAAPCAQGGGTPSAQCTQCQDDSIKMTGSCGADTTYCGTCYAAYSACQADLP
jgi:hypothetical protein